MIRRPPSSTRPPTLFPYPPLFRSEVENPHQRHAGEQHPQGDEDELQVGGVGVVQAVLAGHVKVDRPAPDGTGLVVQHEHVDDRSEEHTSELQSLMRISYAVFCLKKKTYQPLL